MRPDQKEGGGRGASCPREVGKSPSWGFYMSAGKTVSDSGGPALASSSPVKIQEKEGATALLDAYSVRGMDQVPGRVYLS